MNYLSANYLKYQTMTEYIKTLLLSPNLCPRNPVLGGNNLLDVLWDFFTWYFQTELKARVKNRHFLTVP